MPTVDGLAGSSVASVLEFLADVAFFVLGVGMILYALFRASTKGHAPIDIAIAKLGTFKMDFVAFLVVIGIASSGVGVFFRYRGYEGRLHELEKTQATLTESARALQFQIDRFKNYNVNLVLKFDKGVNREGLKITGLVRAPGEQVPRMINTDVPEADSGTPSNIVSVSVGHLNTGDRLSFRVSDATRSWVSEEFEVPIVTLNMQEPK
jgi:hypothetical protein